MYFFRHRVWLGNSDTNYRKLRQINLYLSNWRKYSEAHLPIKALSFRTVRLLRKPENSVDKASSRYARLSRSTTNTSIWTCAMILIVKCAIRRCTYVYTIGVHLYLIWNWKNVFIFKNINKTLVVYCQSHKEDNRELISAGLLGLKYGTLYLIKLKITFFWRWRLNLVGVCVYSIFNWMAAFVYRL